MLKNVGVQKLLMFPRIMKEEKKIERTNERTKRLKIAIEVNITHTQNKMKKKTKCYPLTC